MVEPKHVADRRRNPFASAKSLTITDSGTIQVDSPSGATLSGPLLGTGNLVKTGSGSLVLAANNTFSGGTTISAGTLQIGNGGATGSIAGDVTDNATVAFNRSDAVTFGGAISGSGGLTQGGSGILVLTGGNTYTGGTTLAAGTLSIGTDSNIGGAGSAINFHGGILQVTGTAITNLDSHTINWGSFNGGIDVNNAGNTFTISEAISGSGRLTKAGPGTLVVSGSNSYSGGTTLAAGAEHRQ